MTRRVELLADMECIKPSDEFCASIESARFVRLHDSPQNPAILQGTAYIHLSEAYAARPDCRQGRFIRREHPGDADSLLGRVGAGTAACNQRRGVGAQNLWRPVVQSDNLLSQLGFEDR